MYGYVIERFRIDMRNGIACFGICMEDSLCENKVGPPPLENWGQVNLTWASELSFVIWKLRVKHRCLHVLITIGKNEKALCVIHANNAKDYFFIHIYGKKKSQISIQLTSNKSKSCSHNENIPYNFAQSGNIGLI